MKSDRMKSYRAKVVYDDPSEPEAGARALAIFLTGIAPGLCFMGFLFVPWLVPLIADPYGDHQVSDGEAAVRFFGAFVLPYLLAWLGERVALGVRAREQERAHPVRDGGVLQECGDAPGSRAGKLPPVLLAVSQDQHTRDPRSV